MMNDHFADWHRAVSIDLAGIDLEARWSAVEVVVEEIEAHQVAQLVELAFGQARESTDDVWFRRPFKDREPAFAMKGNEREMSMLAAAVLLEIVSGDDDVTVLAAYMCDLTRFLGWTQPIDDMVGSARRRLVELAVSRRTIGPAPEVKAPGVWTKPIKDILDPLEGAAYPSGDVFRTAVTKLAQTAGNAVAAAFSHADDVAAWAGARLEVAEEETDLLWWLLSGHSDSLGVAWSELAGPAIAVGAARELAERVKTLPAPAQCDGLLAQMLAAASAGKGDGVRHPDPPDVPAELQVVLANADHDDVSMLAQHSLRQALTIRAWHAATS